MKTVAIVHGWDGHPNELMHKWLKSSLETEGYSVLVPEMPDTDTPKIDAWVGKLKEIIHPDENTILVGHSIGCQAVLRYLETIPENIKIASLVLIAPWMKLDENTIEEEGEEVKEIARPWMETPIDFEKVKSHVSNITAIFSDNDPYVPIASEKPFFEQNLGAKTIVEHDRGHFTDSDGGPELQSALDAILKL